MEDERPVSFLGVTGPGETTSVTHEFTTSGTIVGAAVHTHPGQEYTLEQHAEIVRDGSPVSLWEPLGYEFLAGDGESYEFPLRFEFGRGDVLKLEAVNTSGEYEYHHNMIVEVDYETGLADRLASAIRRSL